MTQYLCIKTQTGTVQGALLDVKWHLSPQFHSRSSCNVVIFKLNIIRPFLIVEICYFFPCHAKNPLAFNINSLMLQDRIIVQIHTVSMTIDT